MGYACPVCSDPQADAGHLANHLAFSAILGNEEHESWLDDRAPGWGKMSEAELADAVGEAVEETEFPQLFEDTVGGLEDDSDDPPAERSGALFEEGHGHDHTQTAPERGGTADASEPVDDETAEILEEAREMTRRMHDGSDDGE